MNDGGFGPGIGAFVVFFLLALALWLLMRNMNSRLRRMSYVARVEQEGGMDAADSRSEGHPADAAGPSAASSGDAIEGDRGGDEVGGEGQDRQGVEDLVEPEPPR